jgi:hypothetical protein
MPYEVTTATTGTVLAHPPGKTASVDAARRLSSNYGAGARVDLLLPGCLVPGLVLDFLNLTASGMRIYPMGDGSGAGDQAALSGSKTSAGTGYLSTTDVGAFISLVSDGAGTWYARCHERTWTVV